MVGEAVESLFLSEIESEIINLNRTLEWFVCPLSSTPLSLHMDPANVQVQLHLCTQVRQVCQSTVPEEDYTASSLQALAQVMPPLCMRYQQFADQFGATMEALKQEDENSPFRLWCKEVEKTVRQSLEGCLIVSVTLIPRLHRLLQRWLVDMQSGLARDDTRLHVLGLLVECGGKATVQINGNISVSIAAIKTAENRHRVLEIQARFFGDVQLERPGRTYVREGELRRVGPAASRVYRFFLFSDILVYATALESPACLVLDRVLLLAHTRCCDVVDSTGLRNAFQILNPERSFTVVAETLADKQEWIGALNATIEKASGADADHVKPTNWPAACSLCSSFFTIVRLKHHCHFCGRVFCNECSSQQYKLPYNNPIPHLRLCDQCYIGVSLSTKYETSIVRPRLATAAYDVAMDAITASVPGLGNANMKSLVRPEDTVAGATAAALEQLHVEFPFMSLMSNLDLAEFRSQNQKSHMRPPPGQQHSRESRLAGGRSSSERKLDLAAGGTATT